MIPVFTTQDKRLLRFSVDTSDAEEARQVLIEHLAGQKHGPILALIERPPLDFTLKAA